MKKTFKSRAAQFIVVLVVAAGLSACHKTPLSSNPAPVKPVSLGDWKKITALPTDQIQVLEAVNNTIYAASASGFVYSSTDGATWTTSSQVPAGDAITALTVFKNKLYIGTETQGIFASTDGGRNWTNSVANFPTVSSFAELNDTLYSASAAYSGIIKLDEALNQWSSFNKNGLPTNYNLDVQKVIPVNNTLVSVQGENGNYYIYNKKTTFWNEEYFLKNNYTPGLRVNDMIYDFGVLYAAYDNAILSSQNAGVNWSYDTVGLKRGPNQLGRRVIYAGMDYYYTLYYAGKTGTWVQKRLREIPGSSWAIGEELLPVGDSYSIREFKGMLFLATDNGLYFKYLPI